MYEVALEILLIFKTSTKYVISVIKKSLKIISSEQHSCDRKSVHRLRCSKLHLCFSFFTSIVNNLLTCFQSLLEIALGSKSFSGHEKFALVFIQYFCSICLQITRQTLSWISHMEEDFAFHYEVCSLELLSAFEHAPYWLQPSVILQEVLAYSVSLQSVKIIILLCKPAASTHLNHFMCISLRFFFPPILWLKFPCHLSFKKKGKEFLFGDWFLITFTVLRDTIIWNR